MEYKFNINNYVGIKLNDAGYQHIIDNYSTHSLEMTKLELLEKTDEDGYFPLQMHEFMSMFGEFGIHPQPKFSIDIKIASKDLERLGNK